jgi:hypothetical protein
MSGMTVLENCRAALREGGGFRRQEGEIDALRIHAANGDATSHDKIKLTFNMTVLRSFQSNETSACTYQFIKEEKI